MNNRGPIILVTVILLLLGAILLLFYEVKHVPDLNWSPDYRYESQEAYGTWLFREMLKDKYGEENIYRNSIDTSFTEIVDSNNLYIVINKNHIEVEKLQELRTFAEYGNDILIIGNANLVAFDSLCIRPRKTDYTEKVRDSILNFAFTDQPDDIYSFKYYRRNFNTLILKDYRFPSYNIDSEGGDSLRALTPIIESKNGGQIMIHWDFVQGNVYQHLAPYLFANISSKQEYFLTHFNKVLADLNPKRVILDHTNYEPFSFSKPGSKKSPLEFFLAETSLRWGYYTLLFAFLCYLLFRGKRKQKAIPLLEQNENTTLSYVETLSELYLSQDQNRKLVPHLEEIFMHHVQSKYFLQPSQENFEHLLSRKSKIAERDIAQIMKGFKNQKDGFEFSDEQLAQLHHRIENFYKNAE